MKKNYDRIAVFSPFIIIAINVVTAVVFGHFVGKWAFIPIILVEWLMFLYFIYLNGGTDLMRAWLEKPVKNRLWPIISLLAGLLPLPIFVKHYSLLDNWQIGLPWITLAVINPFLEEFYWRGLLADVTANWKTVDSIIYASVLFAANHVVFGINSELFRGFEVLVSTFVMGIVWAVTYRKTNSLRWVILSHFLVDFLNLSAPAFLNLFKAGH
ncbi:CPBP family intramembrane glutamic endopeptidase [Epilithonimonas arachidiradicis]|uniref:CAAX prenyl protease 2/Lysostaphin resistance protein A-like domain-containing protein n=1 Tax=Epilithonimonas arachidiradicis TaxID=1617282 RepID=A0A420D994_9FLAO|nr:CPBP family intramembrane glutamic endopeptidase [Epilithonimonas arachidiradicis]RKE87275.1 hypothetical protein BXY58_2156 [Epilithonimonas arachidiradicis]GGG59667.1 hypothetical protein GCM10007332_21670 [Epilithonimonas arachidiradicis]